MFFIDVNRLTLPRRHFWAYFLNAFLYRCFFNIDYRYTYRYVGKQVEENIKNTFYICIKFVGKRPKEVWKKFLDDIRIDVLRTYRERQFNTLYKIY